MNNATLSQLLWNLSNAIVGFAVAQTLVFAYKMADENFSDLIDNPHAKAIVAAAIALSFVAYLVGFYRIAGYLVELDTERQPLRATIYREAIWWRVVIIVPLLLANLAALFGRQILLGRWLFGCPRPTQIASVKPGPVTVVGTVKAAGDGARRVEDPSGSIDVHAEGRTAELLAQSSALGRRVCVIGRIDEQGRFRADAVH